MIAVRNLTKRYVDGKSTFVALDDLSFDVAPNTFCTLLGPSGCGKTTLMRCVAGLETPSSGEIEINGRIVFSSSSGINIPPNKRNIGMVFQSYAIWPHMTVFENVAFPLRVRKDECVEEKVGRALRMVGLESLGQRYASRLSGGQQQRIAFARAVVAEPELLMLDEPLSNLDATLRDSMRAELRKLHRALQTTALYVTHDQAEALSLSDKVALMKGGRFMEISSPEELYYSPKTSFGAKFIGASNMISGRVREPLGSTASLIDTEIGSLVSGDQCIGPAVHVFFRPEKVEIVPSSRGLQGDNAIPSVVENCSFVGGAWEVELVTEKGGYEIRATSIQRLDHGAKVVAVVRTEDVRVVPA